MRIRVHGPPCACQWTPPFERRNMAPFANGPPLSKEETRPGPLTLGGGGSQNDQRDEGIILSHKCWVDPPPGTAIRGPQS